MGVKILEGDCREMLKTLADQSVNCCVTSPPYFGLRDYGVADQIGLEKTPDEFVAQLVSVFREVRRVLRDDGTLWLNLGDSYAGSTNTGGTNSKQGDAKRIGAMNGHKRQLFDGIKTKDLIGIPWRVAFALQADGWYLRQEIIWAKPNPMPESVTDRCTKAHEYIFLLSKRARYYFDADAIAELSVVWGGFHGSRADKSGANGDRNDGGRCNVENDKATRNKRSVWTVATQSFKEAHFATFPPDLIEPCILAGCPKGGTVLDPFGGAGTTGLVAARNGRNAILVELNPAYATMAIERINGDAPLFGEVAA